MGFYPEDTQKVEQTQIVEGSISNMEAIEVIGRTLLGIRMLSRGERESLTYLLFFVGDSRECSKYYFALF